MCRRDCSRQLWLKWRSENQEEEKKEEAEEEKKKEEVEEEKKEEEKEEAEEEEVEEVEKKEEEDQRLPEAETPPGCSSLFFSPRQINCPCFLHTLGLSSRFFDDDQVSHSTPRGWRLG